MRTKGDLGIRGSKGPEPSDVEEGCVCPPPGSLIFEKRALLVRGNHARCDTDPEDGVEKKNPSTRDNTNHVKKLR